MPSLVLLTETPDRHICPLGKATLVVGSDDHSDLHLPSSTISKDHASIVFENGEFILRDNGSTSGSFVNGEPITEKQLKHQDLIRFGEYLFMVDLQDEPEETIFTETINPTHDVTVSEGQAGFSKVVNITQPDALKRQTQNLRDKRTSQNIRLLLSEPVSYPQQQKAKRSAPSVKIRKTWTGSPSSILFNVFVIPITVLVTVFLTLFLLPVSARDVLVKSPGFQQLPLSDLISGLIFRNKDNQKEVVSLQPGVAYGTKMTLLQDALIVGTVKLGVKPAAPIHLHLYLKTNDQTPTILMEKTVEIKKDSISLELFSNVLTPGTYNFECVWEIPAAELFENNERPRDEIMRKREVPATIFLSSWL
jgi:pSer/pThr/pTyr-binding forkhead associated (FHA) protein